MNGNIMAGPLARPRRSLVALAALSGIVGFALSCLQYARAGFDGNAWLWWLASMALLAVGAGTGREPDSTARPWKIALVLAIVYFGVHLLLLPHSPWNENGLFDDAAWDVYFAKTHVGAGSVPFQPAYFDDIGAISREVLFHYYIVAFFKCFGYNLLTFNHALLCLGYVTLVFTVLAVDRLCRQPLVLWVGALVLGVFPLYFTQIFIGHRYAMAPPLIAASYYFIISAFQNRSALAAVLAGLLGAFCVESAVMGKQYLLGLAFAAVTSILFHRRTALTRANIRISGYFVGAVLLGLAPLAAYVIYNTDAYYVRERNLIRDFKLSIAASGVLGIEPYVQQIQNVFFSKWGDRRFFSPEFYAIPFTYYGLIVPGLFVALRRRHPEIVILALLPVAGAFVAGCTDFRVLICVPFWILAVCLALDALLKLVRERRGGWWAGAACCAATIAVVVGVTNSGRYVWRLARDPLSMWFLPHGDVGVARVIQDIAYGETNPSPHLKPDEFRREMRGGADGCDLLASPEGAYAIAHLFLKDADDEQILSFNKQLTQRLLSAAELLEANISAVRAYVPSGRDLKLVWQVSEKAAPAIGYFRQFCTPENVQVRNYELDGAEFSICCITVPAGKVEAFRRAATVQAH
jgi:hypothetical protein